MSYFFKKDYSKIPDYNGFWRFDIKPGNIE